MTITQPTIDRLLKDQKGLCPLCGRDLYQGYHVHHAIYTRQAKFSKWLDSIQNLVLLCPRCHQNHGRLSNIEGRKRFFKLKIEQGYEMVEWERSIPFVVHDRFDNE
jgi:5-methylcytosine-specific restriction endonuclease McrA